MDKNKSNGKLWRLTKVLYFIITLPLVLFGAGALLFLQEIHRGSYDLGVRINDYFIGTLYMILFLLSYILVTDFIKRIISYINNGTLNGFISYIEILKRFFILIIIIGGIIPVILVSLSQNLRNECTGNNEGFNDYGVCSCHESYKRENGSCKKDIKIYDNGEVSFTYPGKLIVDNKEFEDFKFFEKENIFVKKYNLDSFMKEEIGRIKGYWESGMAEISRGSSVKLEEEKEIEKSKNDYKIILEKIKKGEDDIVPFSHIQAPISNGFNTTNISINGYNGLIINYYFTEDSTMGCITQFVTELLVVKDLNNIYSVMFQNNFGNVLNYLKQFKGDDGEVCLYNSGISDTKSEEASNKIWDYYKNGNSLYGTDYEGFEENYNIIKEIINTIKIK
ncbi:MAG: hypothetical protein WC850_05380 [Candidatus Gracilibacteria bacterium]